MEEFDAISEFTLTYGDKRTYCNRFNDNPHLALDGFDLYLNPANTNNVYCEAEISGFNELVIYDAGKEIQYYHIFLMKSVGENDDRGLNENQVYLINTYDVNQSKLQENLLTYYLPFIKQKCLK